jgi:thioredoxin reductase (NADPH)
MNTKNFIKNSILLSLAWVFSLTAVDKIHKLIIIGGGPSGLTAGIHAARINLQPIIIEGDEPGGLLANAGIVGNWPGFTSTIGPDIIKNVRNHATFVGCTFVQEHVATVDFSHQPFVVSLSDGQQLKSHAVIVATGSTTKKLNCPGEEEYWGSGVATCVLCDGPLFKGKALSVVGGDERALGKALFLTRFSDNITVICDALTASTHLQQQVLQHPHIVVLQKKKVLQIEGNGTFATGIEIQDLITQEKRSIPVEGIFYAVGAQPNTELVKGQLDLDDNGYIKVSNFVHTSVEGIFATGTATIAPYTSAIICAGMGAMAAIAVEEYMSKLFSDQTVQKHMYCSRHSSF